MWQEATRFTVDMINDEWKDKEEVIIDDASQITLYVSLAEAKKTVDLSILMYPHHSWH